MENNINIRVWSERWRLGALAQPELMRIGLISVMIGLLYMMFHMLGNTVAEIGSRSAFQWMVARWHDTISFGADYSHGPLIPFGSAAVLWFKRKEIFEGETRVDWRGLVVIVGALFLHWLGAKMQQTRFSLMSLILLIWGVPFYLYGWRLAKNIIFPCAFLIFCIPLNFLDVIAFPLRIFSTKFGVGLLNTVGIDAVRSGTAILIPSMPTGMDVADPCSGLRSLLAMTALTALYAYFFQKTFIKKWILFLASIPLAVIGNIARITTIAFVAEALGPKPALGLYHDFSGYILFGAAITAMVVFGELLKKFEPMELYAKWKSAR